MSETIQYQPLPERYVSHSYTFRLIKRTGDVAMFGAWADGQEPKEWEVFIVQRQEARTFPGGKQYPPKEKVPSDEQWGTYAWTCCSKDAAEFRFEMALQRQQANAGGTSPAV